MVLTAPWDGHGMTATQSHGFEFRDFPVARIAGPGTGARSLTRQALSSDPVHAVIPGIVEAAMATARDQLSQRASKMRPYEQVEWTNAEQEAWLLVQAYEGMLRAVETSPKPQRQVLVGKTAAARLAEDCLRRLTRIMGGGRSPGTLPSVSGSRMSGRWDFSGLRGASRMTRCLRHRSLRADRISVGEIKKW